MTEEEAKTKWCPHVRYALNSIAPHANPPGNKFNNSDQMRNCMCMASDCMMWVEEHTEVATYIRGNNDPAFWTTGPTKKISLGGHCGLAGAKQ